MNKEQLLMDVGLEVETLHAHIKRLSRANYPLHSLDVDILREKVRFIYERLFELEQFIEVKPPVYSKQSLSKAAPLEQGKAESTVNTELPKEIKQEISERLREPEIKINEGNIIEDKEDKSSLPIKEIENNDKPDMHNAPADETDNSTRQTDTSFHKEPEVVKTTLDLFSDMTSQTLSDTIGSKDEPSVADSLQKSQIVELRQAIGINEKFQFVNELFNGDLRRYNSAINELNSFTNLDGAKTYLFELRVEYQWADDNLALLKLNELLERRFSH